MRNDEIKASCLLVPAPYDGYIEDDDTEENARNNPLRKVKSI